jgi:hypothetical protein
VSFACGWASLREDINVNTRTWDVDATVTIRRKGFCWEETCKTDIVCQFEALAFQYLVTKKGFCQDIERFQAYTAAPFGVTLSLKRSYVSFVRSIPWRNSHSTKRQDANFARHMEV